MGGSARELGAAQHRALVLTVSSTPNADSLPPHISEALDDPSAGMLIERAIEHAVASGADVTATHPTKSDDSSRSVESWDPALLGRQNMTNSRPSPMNGPPPRGTRRAPADRALVGVDAEGEVGAARPVRTPAPPHAIVDIVDEWGRQSFPASDPPSNW